MNIVPDEKYNNIYEINYELLYKNGIRLLLFDLDNTLIPVNSNYIPERLPFLLKRLKEMGFRAAIISNRQESRVLEISESLNISSYYLAFKPLKRKFITILNDYDLSNKQIVMIGDQIITDIFGAKRMGIYSILVNPVIENELIYNKITQSINKKILKKK